MAITPDDKKISQFPEVNPADTMFVPLIDLDQVDPTLRNVRSTIAAILALVPASGGTVTDFSAGNLSPLFTTSVAASTSTPALSFSLSSHSANQVFAGPTGGGAAAPTFRALVAADIPNLTSIYQPLDADLTAIAALGTTAYGRGFLTQADASAARTYIGAGTGSGTVTSINLTAPAAGITVAGGPITTSGSITLALADDLAALEALTGTDTIYYRSGVSTWTAVTIGSNLLFTGGTLSASAPGTGTVTSFSAGNLSPIFTSNVATATTTPALTFALSNQNANLVFAGPTNGAAAAPTFRSLVAADIPDLSATYQPLNANLTSISALTTTSYGLDFLELADAAAARAYIGAGTGSGTVTSVGLTMPSGFSVGGSPVTTSGTLAVTTTLSGIVVGDGSGLIARTATGTTDRISITNGSGVSGNPTFDIAATYVGQTSITTLGTIATGTWSATTIAASRGGTGQTTYADGDLLYGNGGGLSKLTHPGLLNFILVTSFFGGLNWVDLGVVATTTVTGTANQVLVNGTSGSGQTGAITLTTPQDIHTAATPTFAGLTSPIGASTPNSGAFTTLSATENLSLAYKSVNIINSAATGYANINLSANVASVQKLAQINWAPSIYLALISPDTTPVAILINGGGVGTFTTTGLQGAIGATTPSTGAFTTALVTNNGETLATFPSTTSTRFGVSYDGQAIASILSYGSNPAFTMGSAGGTRASPTATAASSLLALFAGIGYDTTNGWGAGTGTSSARITMESLDNFTAAAQGSQIGFDVTPAGSSVASRLRAALLTSTGFNATAIGATTPSTGAFTTVTATTGTIRAQGFSGTAGSGVLFFGTGSSDYIFHDATDLFFRVGGSDRMTLTTTGINSTAIGTTTPAAGSFTAVTIGSTALLSSTVALSNTPGAGTGTLTNAPANGNPTKWLRINDNGTPIYIPAWVIP